ncbi:MAG: aspartate--tRNA ligase [Nanobdellota archaeon]
MIFWHPQQGGWFSGQQSIVLHEVIKMRTHTCGELNKENIETEATLCGWMHSRRDHGGVIFIDLRDRYGKTQIVFNPDCQYFSEADKARREDVIKVKGKVRARGQDLINPKLKTGEIELVAEELEILSKSETPPLEIDDNKVANEDMRMEYRYLDLRRPEMQKNLKARHDFITAIREYLNNNKFLEIETPMLVKSTPEGARDYVVPSRVNKGNFYALPQSPQLYKQILMISGCDRYYQLAKCLRDEDLRADRQPEHTQLDFEMSFTSQEEIHSVVEGMIKHAFKKAFEIDIETPFTVIPYKEAMDKYGSDKPDIRYDLFLSDVSDIVKESDFGVFKEVVEKGGIVKGINAPSNFGRKELDNYINFAQTNGAKGLAWMRVNENKELESNIAKYFSEDIKRKLVERMDPKPESVLMFVADKKNIANSVLDRIRRKLASDLNLIDPKTYKFCWVNDFPLFSWDEDEQRWAPEHHIFSMPKKEYVDKMEENPEVVLGDLWDLTLNGWEMASGSIRVSNPDIQKRLFNIIGLSEEEAENKFGFLLKAYKYGGPVHGGMGIGIARFLALALGYDDIREVITFPKNKNAQCPMDGSPSEISGNQLKELGLEIKKNI